MESKYLETFVAVMELGSLSAAARRLGRSQSQLSQWMAELEVDTGLCLFERSGNRALPTAQAQQWLPWARQALQQLHTLQRRTQALAGSQCWQLTIAVEECLSPQVMAPALSVWHQRWPGRLLTIGQYEHGELMYQLEQQQLQLALAYEHQDHLPGFNYRRLGYMDEVFVASHEWVKTCGFNPTAQQLCQQLELVWAGQAAEELKQTPASVNEALNPDHWLLSDIGLLKQLLIRGCGYALLPRLEVQAEIDAGQLTVVQPDFETAHIDRRIQLLWAPGLEQQEEVGSLIELLAQSLEPTSAPQ